MVPAPGAGQVFWQSSSMLQAVAQLEGNPPPPEVLVALSPPAPPPLVVVLVALAPPPLVVELVAVPPPPLVELVALVVDSPAPTPPVTPVSLLPDAQATRIAAAVTKSETREALACFTLLWRPYASVSPCTMPSLR